MSFAMNFMIVPRGSQLVEPLGHLHLCVVYVLFVAQGSVQGDT